jgi:serine/threonine-protein kinase
VAVKILYPILAADPGFQARFEREARRVAALNHPKIVTVFDFGSDDGGSYPVMELVEGEPGDRPGDTADVGIRHRPDE